MGILSKLQILLNDQGVFWPLATILDAVNEAQLYLASEVRWKRTSAALYLNTLDDLVPIPTTILIPQFIEDGSNRYFPTTHRMLEHYDRGWRAKEPSQPRNFVVWDFNHFRVFPKPDTNYTYTLWGLGIPTEVDDASDNLEGPILLQQAIVNLAVSLLLEATRPEVGDVYKALAAENIQKMKVILRNQQSHNIRRLRPGKRFDLQQSGNLSQSPTFFPVEG